MELDPKVVERWRYLRELLMQQLGALERGIIQIHTDSVDVSATAIEKLKWEIADFDALISDAAAPDETAPDGRPNN